MQALWDFLIELLRRSFWFWRVIQPDEAGVRTTIGKWPTILAPGIHLVWPIVGLVRVCKTSEQVSDIRSQSLTTSDGQCFAVGISIAHSIINAQKAMLEVQDAETALFNEALRVVGEYVSSRPSGQCADADAMCIWVLAELRKVATDRWGLKVWRVGRSDWAKHRALRLMSEYSVK